MNFLKKKKEQEEVGREGMMNRTGVCSQETKQNLKEPHRRLWLRKITFTPHDSKRQRRAH